MIAISNLPDCFASGCCWIFNFARLIEYTLQVARWSVDLDSTIWQLHHTFAHNSQLVSVFFLQTCVLKLNFSLILPDSDCECWVRWSICPLVFGCCKLSHVIFLKLLKKKTFLNFMKPMTFNKVGVRVRSSKNWSACASACATIIKVQVCVRHTLKFLATQSLLRTQNLRQVGQ